MGVSLDIKNPICDNKELEDFAKVVSEAWKMHISLKPKILKVGV